MRIISVRESPDYKNIAIKFFQQNWKSVRPIIYEDCITHSIGARNPLPQWYLLEQGNEIIGGAGLITNDFISRGDLYPWICAIFIEEKYRGNAYGSLLIENAKIDAKKTGFEYIGQGYHPWGEESRIYELQLE